MSTRRAEGVRPGVGFHQPGDFLGGQRSLHIIQSAQLHRVQVALHIQAAGYYQDGRPTVDFDGPFEYLLSLELWATLANYDKIEKLRLE
jgi:hypothetical protein